MEVVPMMQAACLISTEATFVDDAEVERDEHVLGLKTLGTVSLNGAELHAEARAMYPKEFIRQLRDALTEWLNDGGHFHVTEESIERMPEGYAMEEAGGDGNDQGA